MASNSTSFSETLLPALLQCFGIMFFGYILGKSKILGKKEAAGISLFVVYLALPAVIFVNISTLSLQNVEWSFIASLFVSKAVIFCCVALLTMLLTRPVNLGKAGMFAIASTQSNDFALGYPLFLSLYQNSNPNYPGYLYIIAPAQLLVFNTIGFFIMEIGFRREGHNNARCHFLKIIKSTLSNPIVFMTIIGMIWNVSFSGIPSILKTTLDSLSQAFPATALLLVGHTMAMKTEKSDNNIPITVTLLIIAKTLISPIIMQKFGTLMIQSNNQSQVESLSSFGFIYGTTPTAPSAYVFATQYDIAVDAITKTIVGSTLVSAPLMFASASVISLSADGTKDVSSYLTITISYLSCISFVCCSWILFSYIIGKRFQHIRFGVTFFIIFSQLLTSIGGILLFVEIIPFSFMFYIQFILSIGGILAARVSTFFLAVLLVVMRWKSVCFILQVRKCINAISILCVACPFVVVACLSCVKNLKPDGPNNQLGYAQAITVFTVTMICCIGTVICLILQHVCFRKRYEPGRNSIEETADDIENSNAPSLYQVTENDKATLTNFEEEISVDTEDKDKHFASLSIDSEDQNRREIQDILCDSSHHRSMDQRLQCARRVSQYRRDDKYGLYDSAEIFQHTFLIIGISVAMTLSLAVCFWKLVMEVVNGIFCELQFLDVIMNYTLGILFFIILGFDTKIFNALSNKWKIMWYGYKKNLINDQPSEICQDFIRKHKDKFTAAYVAKSKVTIAIDCHNIFSSSDLIEWLIEKEDVGDVLNAELYIRYLLVGQIIEEVDKFDCFPVGVSTYRFTN